MAGYAYVVIWKKEVRHIVFAFTDENEASIFVQRINKDTSRLTTDYDTMAVISFDVSLYPEAIKMDM